MGGIFFTNLKKDVIEILKHVYKKYVCIGTNKPLLDKHQNNTTNKIFPKELLQEHLCKNHIKHVCMDNRSVYQFFQEKIRDNKKNSPKSTARKIKTKDKEWIFNLKWEKFLMNKQKILSKSKKQRREIHVS